MSKYLGDYVEDSTHHFVWGSNDAAGGAITRDTDGTIEVWKEGDSTANSTAGITDDEDEGETGIHRVSLVLTDVFYATGKDYTVVLRDATIDGQTVQAVLAEFSIENRFEEVTLGDNANHGGSSAVLTLKQLVVNNPSGAAVDIDGTSSGVEVAASAGTAVSFVSGGTNGSGLLLDGDGTGAGLTIMGDPTGSGQGVKIDGGQTGVGIIVNGGASSGVAMAIASTSSDCITVTASGGNGDGIQITANGTGVDMKLAGSGTIEDGSSNDVTQVGAAAALTAYDPPTKTEMDTRFTAAPAALLDLTDGIETGVTLKQSLQRIGAATAGKVSDAGSGTEIFVGMDGSTVRITATVDDVGNRTAITYDP